MKVIHEIQGMKANGHYALAVAKDNFVFISGQFSVDPETGEKKFGTAKEEAVQILNNIKLILEELGSSKDKVLKAVIYIDDIKSWDSIDQTYSDFFENSYHARTIATLKELHYGFKIEMDIIAYIN